MAELPELTVYAEALAPLLVGRAFRSVEVHEPRVLRGVAPEPFQAAVTGRRVTAVARRGKTLALALDAGPRIDVHLMLGGEPYWLAPGASDATARVPLPVLTLYREDGARLVFSDRHFDLLKPGDAKMWAGLDRKERGGLDPLTPAFTVAALAGLCARNKLWPIKTVLCDQRLIAGLGNAYRLPHDGGGDRAGPRGHRDHAGGGHRGPPATGRDGAAPRRAQARVLPRPPSGAQALSPLRRQDPHGVAS